MTVWYKVHLPSITERVVSISGLSCYSLQQASISYHKPLVICSGPISLSALLSGTLFPVWLIQAEPALSYRLIWRSYSTLTFLRWDHCSLLELMTSGWVERYLTHNTALRQTSHFLYTLCCITRIMLCFFKLRLKKQLRFWPLKFSCGTLLLYSLRGRCPCLTVFFILLCYCCLLNRCTPTQSSAVAEGWDDK